MACVCGHAIDEHEDEIGPCSIDECDCLGFEDDEEDDEEDDDFYDDVDEDEDEDEDDEEDEETWQV